jgi:CCR4-NOT transcription complex subunit 7/8
VLQVASQLGVERIGPQHQAGSDSLLTSNTFMRLLHHHMNGLEEARAFMGVLFQLGEDGERPMYT